MSLIVKVPGLNFTQALPKLYRDAVINSGTKFVHDALNAASYAKQAAPAAGNPSADKWLNLVDGAATGSLILPAASDITWGASGGFVSAGGSADKITALSGAVPSVETKGLGIAWVKHGSGASNNDVVAMFGDMLGIYHANAVNGAIPANRFFVGSSGSATQEITGIGDTTAKVGTVFQLAVAFDNASLTLSVFCNGALVATRAGFQNMPAPTRAHSLMGATGFGAGYVGTFYRWMFDNLSGGKTAAEIVALDYALNAGRFA